MIFYRRILFEIFLLLIVIILFSYTNIDITIQNLFFDRDSLQWSLAKTAQPYKFIFYDGIKALLIFLAVFSLFCILFFRDNIFVKKYKEGLLIIILSSIFIPISIGGLKKYTNMPCPKQTINYGGSYPDIKLWERYPINIAHNKRLQCWPAGHASGGFALFALYFFFKSKKNKLIALGSALIIGWSMGIYKMIIGDHYFSHTIITMILAWIIVVYISIFVTFTQRETLSNR